MPAEKTISVRVPQGLLDEIDQEIELGSYGGRSDFIKAAVRTLLQMNYEKRSKKQEREQADIPIADDAKKSGRA